MKKVFQTRFGDPMGNCTEACVATILGVPLEDVPDLYALCRDPAVADPPHWFDVLDDYARTQGFTLVFSRGAVPPYHRSRYPVMLGGPSKADGVGHYVVGHFAADNTVWLAHDPHEGWDGISAVEDSILFVPLPS